MLAAFRPALGLLLLVGVGVAAVDSAKPCCASVTESRSFLEADDSDARIGGLAAIVPAPPRMSRGEQALLNLDAPPPLPARRTTDVLATAPKTSPPA